MDKKEILNNLLRELNSLKGDFNTQLETISKKYGGAKITFSSLPNSIQGFAIDYDSVGMVGNAYGEFGVGNVCL